MVQKIILENNEIIFLKGKSGTVGVVKFAKNGQIFIGTPDKEEVVMFLEKDDIIAVSALNSGPLTEEGIKSLIFLLRDMGTPLVVLPKDHPTSKRLPMVASCGETIRLDCNITPGTHPEQNILCACEDLSGILMKATAGGVEIHGSLKDFKIEKFQE
ncbi:hypothetical protein [Methanobacterium petrolearium]|uniref:hypothetical protein n=1 Tax=Methanobacterium petrolearium TaxID=710190 RepID=UPI001AE717CC|nr:hypothetical protein [Methanobacterium petrolearium]MBP1946178.1 hypothetical protein [Methanobacterium petrolearium]BDZ70676.1 hypothetical protein GCM10025861_11930 [Methanobacterium petrolearium]